MSRWATVTALGLVLLPAAGQALPRGGFDYSGEGGYYATGIGGQVPGWTRVDLRFVNGDHHLSQFYVGPNGPTDYLVGWGDATCSNPFIPNCGGEDTVSGSVRWADLSRWGGKRVTTNTNCSGTCTLTIPVVDQGEYFALLGFQFSWNRHVDHHLREIAVVPDPYRGRIYATFADNAGTEPFTAVVTYAVLPVEALAPGTSPRSASGVEQDSVVISRTPGLAVLRGFRLAFTNGDHHMQRFTIDLTPSDFIRMRFRDINGDDPYEWWISYLLLRE